MHTPDLENVKKTLQQYPFPVDVIVEVTAYCNLQCIMCPQPFLSRDRGEMDFALFMKIADEVAQENPTARMWLAIMGEPLLPGDRLIAMIRYAKHKQLEIHLNTNGVLLTPALTEQLIDSGVDEILIGVDAFTEATYNTIRVNGNFPMLLENIAYFLRLRESRHVQRPALVMQFIMMDENAHEVEEFKAYWLKQGAVVKIRPKLGWGAGIKADNLTLPDSERTFPCPWLVRTISLHWNGNLIQCDGDWDGKYSVGNVRDMTIKAAWEGELARRRAKHWHLDFSHDLCRHCKDWQAGRSQFYYP